MRHTSEQWSTCRKHSLSEWNLLRVSNPVDDLFPADWAITTPLLLLDILLLAGLSIGDTLWILFADIAMIVTGLFGALLPNRYKWGGYHIPEVYHIYGCAERQVTAT